MTTEKSKEPTKFYVYALWSKEGTVTSLQACLWEKEEVKKHLEDKKEGWIEPIETSFFKYPIWILEHWVDKTNSFEIFVNERKLAERLDSIKIEEKNLEDDDYPYVLYPIGENTITKDGMGELRHIHITDDLLKTLDVQWWDFDYEFIRNEMTPFKNDQYEGFELAWAAKRIGWGEMTFSRKVSKDENVEHPYTVNTEFMSDDFCIALLTDFFQRCKK